MIWVKRHTDMPSIVSIIIGQGEITIRYGRARGISYTRNPAQTGMTPTQAVTQKSSTDIFMYYLKHSN